MSEAERKPEKAVSLTVKQAMHEWFDGWFGDGCPPWTWPLAVGAPMILVAIIISFV